MLDKNLGNAILSEALSTGGDYAEIYVENTRGLFLNSGNDKIKSCNSGLSYGMGIRIFKDDFFTYVYTNVMDRENLLQTAAKAAKAIKGAKQNVTLNLVDAELENKHKIMRQPSMIPLTDKVNKLKQLYDFAHNFSPLIERVDGAYLDEEKNFLVANSEGVWVEDARTRMRFTGSAIAVRDNLKENSGNNVGGLYGFELFEQFDLKCFAEEIAESAIHKLDAINCPSGKMTAIIHNGFGGAIFHEASGHPLEAVAIAKDSSPYVGKLGEKIANEVVSAVDDATIANAWGSVNVDDEGVMGERKLLIENGILKNYLVDRFNGRKLGLRPNGSCRRQNYKFAPTSRMSNTFILNGKSSFEEIIGSTEKGIFAKKMGGGSVNPATGDFNFSVDEAFLIENGKITQQVKGAKLIGRSVEVLQNIDMVGNNMTLACGMCGASSGSIPTTVGQPTIRVQNITVGGQD